jgi:predicted TIM-barrel fold metal-dependent hydrolase
MSQFLTDDDLNAMVPAESTAFRSPIPTQVISNGEFVPGPQTEDQRKVEARIDELSGALARRHNMPRRAFLRTAAGMATAFIAMNDIYGPVFGVSEAEAAIPEQAEERARRLARQFVFDDHTHFLRPDAGPESPLRRFVGLRRAAAKAGWNPAMGTPESQKWEDLQFDNYVKEMFFDSDTKIAIISGAPSEVASDWFLTNEMKAEARDRLNRMAGSKRLFTHAVFAPGQDGWLDDVDKAIALKPDSWKGYTIGDNTHKDKAKPWLLDDEKLVYPAYEKFDKAGIRHVCIHKGLFPPSLAKKMPHLEKSASVADVGKAAKDWPQLNFLIYHAAYRHTAGGTAEEALAEFDRTGRVSWVTDLAEIPEKFGVTNVYADLGATFASMAVQHPRLAAILLGTLVKGLGADRVVWGTDSLWYGSPQWQIEALRRLEIPEDLQKKHGFAPLGPDDGVVKSAILGFNSARLYELELKATLRTIETDRLAETIWRVARAGRCAPTATCRRAAEPGAAQGGSAASALAPPRQAGRMAWRPARPREWLRPCACDACHRKSAGPSATSARCCPMRSAR